MSVLEKLIRFLINEKRIKREHEENFSRSVTAALRN
jgi:hypothetical protein